MKYNLTIMATKKKSVRKNEPLIVSLTNIRLSRKSKAAIRKWEKQQKKDGKRLRSLCGDTVFDIENGHWSGPSKTYEFIDIKTCWEKEYHTWFGIPKDVLVEIDCFDTGILSFEKGVYPKYHD